MSKNSYPVYELWMRRKKYQVFINIKTYFEIVKIGAIPLSYTRYALKKRIADVKLCHLPADCRIPLFTKIVGQMEIVQIRIRSSKNKPGSETKESTGF